MTEADYRGYRIEVYAELTDGHWDATARIRRLTLDASVHVERVACRKVTAGLAETRAAIWAKRWVDLHGLRGEPASRPA